ncbi:MAG: glucose-6-phosphate dehydrogenase [Gaiellales bacterium]
MAELTVENPLRAGLRLSDVPGPCALVIFGGSGDLAHRKLVPALYNLALRGLLPAGFGVVGIGRSDYGDDDGFRNSLKESVARYSRTQPLDETVWESFAQGLCYVRGAFDDPGLYRDLTDRLGSLDDQRGTAGNAVFYLATPPTTFPIIVGGLGDSGLSHEDDGRFRRVVIEKPFGRGLTSALELNTQVHEAFEERQVFRIDHYLGKETVQNILVLRFANGIFEPVWNRNFVDHVQITVAESIGAEGRGRFYEEAGALRDIVQNHLLQVLSFVAMEPPSSFQAEAVRDERAKVLGAVRPMRTTDVVRGQYAAGFSEGVPVPGYVEEDGVAPNSATETFVAARLSLDNWRWADTPFYLRTGKRLPKRVTEVAIQFKRVPHLPFSYSAAEQLEPNVLVLHIQPDEGISLRFGAKVPASRTQIRTVNMDFDYGTAFSSPTAEAYETLLLDAMRGDPTNFTRQDAVTESWRVVEPALEAWQRQAGAPHLYAAGTWGPDAADDLLARDGRRWRRP